MKSRLFRISRFYTHLKICREDRFDLANLGYPPLSGPLNLGKQPEEIRVSLYVLVRDYLHARRFHVLGLSAEKPRNQRGNFEICRGLWRRKIKVPLLRNTRSARDSRRKLVNRPRPCARSFPSEVGLGSSDFHPRPIA